MKPSHKNKRKKPMKLIKTLVTAAAVGLLIQGLSGCSERPSNTENTPSVQEQAGQYSKTSNGIVVNPATGKTQTLQLQVVDNGIIRVSASPLSSINLPDSIMVVAAPKTTAFEISEENRVVTLSTAKMSAKVSLDNGKLRFFNNKGETLLSTLNSGEFSPVTRDPSGSSEDSFALKQSFIRSNDEAYYGLGQHQNGQVNLARENVYLTTYNLIISIPYLISSKNYGILWDNNSDSRFGKPTPPTPLIENLKLFDAEGKEGGLTARYYDGDKLLLERVETDLNYQFLTNNTLREIPLPAETANATDLRIEWQGSMSSETKGKHELLMYSSGYAKLNIDGEVKLDRWRMNWNPWYHNVKLDFVPGVKKAIHVSWTPQGGYFRLLHHTPSAESRGELMSLASDTGKAIDYYVVAGENSDELISAYRQLTGKSVMLPRWAYGFWQSRERYKSQDELLGALKEYRKREIPIDNIVLDWSYWPTDAWGSHDFDKAFFPNPKAMVDEVHDLNAQIMISVWPKFYPTTDNYKALNEKGYMLNGNIEAGNHDWIAPGYLNAFYDAYNPGARDLFWQQLDEKINVHGFDAWWLDAVEPDMHSNTSWEQRKSFMSPNHLGSGAEVFNAYSVPHAQSVYEGDRASAPDTRVFILTRSGFGGIQRTASAIWSGDTVARWSNLKEQIAAGVGTAMSGVPNWTLDIGGFTPEDRFRSNAGKFVGPHSDLATDQVAEWQELNTRWYQFGAFLPLYRAHGQNPYREIYNISDEGSATYNSMVWYTRLRYRLMPYIYSQAGDMYHKDGTLMRGLAMDFPNDKVAGDLNDQYMFGPALLVSPVYELGARSRSVYLPKDNDWYNFYSGERLAGGQHISAAAPYERIPLFVRAGSILPTGPAVQYADQVMNADITLSIYAGANGKFELYEDDGRTYGYEKGEWSRIPFSYDNASGTIEIGKRIGGFKGMSETRTIHLRLISGKTPEADNFDSQIVQSVAYSGEATRIQLH